MPGSACFDLGSGSGFYALVFASRGATRVLAVEADPGTCERLRRNVAANPALVDSIEVSEERVGPEAGLDELAYRPGGFVPDLVKMDVEGNEVAALRGAPATALGAQATRHHRDPLAGPRCRLPVAARGPRLRRRDRRASLLATRGTDARVQPLVRRSGQAALMTTPDFGRLAAEYDRVRPVDDNWRELFELVVREGDLRGRRVLDCGCGTGRLSQALAETTASKVWGVDPEPEMLRVAADNVPASVGLKPGRAEDLPFRDGWFERAVMWLVCHLVDRPLAFRELHRVLGRDGRLVVVTFDPAHFGDFWLNRYFPSIEVIDRARFPDADELGEELVDAGFDSVALTRHSQRAAITREHAIERIEQRHISTFDLLAQDELERGTMQAMNELPPTVEYPIEWLVAVAIA